MRHGPAGRRSRNRGNGGRRNNPHNNNKNRVYDSNGPDVRIRGTAHQIFEKYVALAKDVSSTGDYVLAESYLQYAEHYQRIITDWHQIVLDAENGIDIDAESYGAQDDAEDDFIPFSPQAPAAAEDLGLPASIVGAGETRAVPAQSVVRKQHSVLEGA